MVFNNAIVTDVLQFSVILKNDYKCQLDKDFQEGCHGNQEDP
jgi:hypothetical protein